MFLPVFEKCVECHLVTPIKRGSNGDQLKFMYSSPKDTDTYGSISLTFYPSTSRLLVQGSSYLLWVVEYLPHTYLLASNVYTSDPDLWRSKALEQNIGTN